ncbi:unnamed protein product, partial [Discosporangium mesarthrocarpum]
CKGGARGDKDDTGGRGGGGSGSVRVTVSGGSYVVPAEELLCPPAPPMCTLAGFQSAWSGLPFAHAVPVSSDPSLEAFCQTAWDLCLAMETLDELSVPGATP